MIDRIKERQRSENPIGPCITLVAWVTPSNTNRQGLTAAPRDVIEAQAEMLKRAQSDLQRECFLVGLTIGAMEDGGRMLLQMQAKYQGFDKMAASAPMALSSLGPGKTRLISLED